ncbi:glycosyltransferase [Pseudoalteromonas sp. MMG013]|uniref:glycosyltransferase n=1 Tax=Pseudoalteromonas sp. MMG013 TaxID=2822687 RepID=UPI001B35A408|nr:glycosyltransferase [Pseudoalteromonas sp. MMG013]MBQ4860871.1 glycosyltransferase [Pseudoalteromonas sp. MMG013]
MEEKPLVSATVVSYNQEHFIAECLESILAQDYENFEIVVSDDASTDRTPEILKGYQAKYPEKIRINLNENNLGITKNSNKSLLMAKGDFITFTAGDDLMLPGKISKQVKHMLAHPQCHISYHNSEVFQSETKEVLGYSKNLSFSGNGSFIDLIEKGCFVGGCEAMVRRSKVPEYGYDERLIIGSDWKLMLDVLESGGEVRYLDEVLAGHRRHKSNVTSDTNKTIRLNSYQDLLTTCSIILNKSPKLRKAVSKRESLIYRSMRHLNDGQYYRDYLFISMKKRFTITALGLVVLSLFGAKK